jgi:hypothetical protein
MENLKGELKSLRAPMEEREEMSTRSVLSKMSRGGEERGWGRTGKSINTPCIPTVT